MTILLNIQPKIGLKRKKNSKLSENRYENFDFKFHEMIQNKFLEVSKIYSNRFEVIDSSNNKEFVFEEVVEKIKHFFKKK